GPAASEGSGAASISSQSGSGIVWGLSDANKEGSRTGMKQATEWNSRTLNCCGYIKGVSCNPCPGRRLSCFLILSIPMNTGQTTDPSSQQVPAPAPPQPEPSQTDASQPESSQSSAEPQQPT